MRKCKIVVAILLLVYLHRHGVIMRENDEYWVIGAGGEWPSEVCMYTDDKMKCTEQQPTLSLYGWYPELFLVDEHYCIITK